ncbi:galactosyltransferase-related protein [uncultured Aquimarina sp.]|uniref:galactosyltransferase-related protein n=1 Tax=uncultured Aquimarina sp. TaxID=575652 RepID=UPI002612E019|nr:galactosyltransferase-related protein [uncultured Aquimarina sp.]
MNKVIYCFTLREYRKQHARYQKEIRFEDALKLAIKEITLSILISKKKGFVTELITDVESYQVLKNLPCDKLSLDLEFISDKYSSWVEVKAFIIAKQTEPFVYMDWNILLNDDAIVQSLKNCKEDFVIASLYDIPYYYRAEDQMRVSHRDIGEYSWLIDIGGNYIEEFQQHHLYAFNCSILGFNNLDFRDAYIENFLKCLNVIRKTDKKNDSMRTIEEYLLYAVAKSRDASYNALFHEIYEERKRENNLFNSRSLLRSKKLREALSKILLRQEEHRFSSSNLKDRKFSLILAKHRKLRPDLFNEQTLKLSKILAKKTPTEIHDIFKKEFPDHPLVSTKTNTKAFNGVMISLCTVVMNRKEHLIKTLKHNLSIIKEFKGKVDINVINYNSTDGLEDYLFEQSWFLKGVQKGYINYYRNYSARFYHRTLPKNAIHFLAEGTYLINIDADNFVSTDYLKYCMSSINEDHNVYFRPSRESASGTYGRIGIHRRDFKHIGGYNLKIENYGFEDVEITIRLRKKGVNQLLVPAFLCQDAIDHKDEIRTENEKNTKIFNDNCDESDHRNRRIEFDLYPNKYLNVDIEVFKINHKRIPEKVLDLEVK